MCNTCAVWEEGGLLESDENDSRLLCAGPASNIDFPFLLSFFFFFLFWLLKFNLQNFPSELCDFRLHVVTAKRHIGENESNRLAAGS